jgi:hypothetical protein
LTIHGGGCPASHADQQGRPLCIFCEDGLSCPQQRKILASGDNLHDRVAAIVKIRRPGQDLERRQALNRSILRSTVAAGVTKSQSEEDQMNTSEIRAAVPSPTVPSSTSIARARICGTPGCKQTLSYNNRNGVCGNCQAKKGKRSHSKKTNGHNGVQQVRALQAPRERQAAPPAKRNGAAHHPAHRNGNGAQRAEEPSRLLVMPNVDSRVDLLLAAVPREAKAKMLDAWLAGQF